VSRRSEQKKRIGIIGENVYPKPKERVAYGQWRKKSKAGKGICENLQEIIGDRTPNKCRISGKENQKEKNKKREKKLTLIGS